MFKVMIADDESWIRKGLKAMIEWDRLGLVWDGEATDGLEALQIAKERSPDILITDVRMPGIDGLGLAEKMLETHPRLKVLIVSGYSEFEYAKRAIQLAAVSYILKPINPAELNDTLEKAVRQLKSDLQAQNAGRDLPGLIKKLTAEVCLGRASASAELTDALRLQGTEAGEAAAFAIHYDEDQFDLGTMSALAEQGASAASVAGGLLVIWERKPSRLGAIVFGENGDAIRRGVDRFRWELKKRNVSGVWVALGDPAPVADTQAIALSWRQALSVSERYAFNRSEDLIPYSSREEERDSYKFPLHLQKKLAEALIRNETGSYGRIIDEIDEYYRKTEGASLKHARSFFLSIVADAVKFVLAQPSFRERIVQEGFDFCLNVEEYDSLSRMTGWLRDFLAEIGDYVEDASGTDVQRNIRLAADYIREHFAEDISLNSVSTRFHVTSSYFSSMFKEIIGENFVEFLTRARMEKAKDYLANSGLKIGEISERVGYSDGRYFSKLFKKHTGMMPSEYRQQPDGPNSRADGRDRT